MIARLVSMAFVAMRCWLVGRFFTSDNVFPWIFGISELLALGATVYALGWGRVDASWRGLLLPVLHLVVLLFDFSAPCGPGIAGGLYFCLAPLQIALRLRLGLSCTVGVPCWVKLREGWPYSWIRHPLQLLEAGLAVLAVVYASGAWNYAVLAVYLAVIVPAIVAIEESFLRSECVYLAYCGRVRWRLLPWVF